MKYFIPLFFLSALFILPSCKSTDVDDKATENSSVSVQTDAPTEKQYSYFLFYDNSFTIGNKHGFTQNDELKKLTDFLERHNFGYKLDSHVSRGFDTIVYYTYVLVYNEDINFRKDVSNVENVKEQLLKAKENEPDFLTDENWAEKWRIGREPL